MSLEVIVRGITIPADELSWRFSRSQGPGGQSVNTTDSQAELSFDLAATPSRVPPLLKERALAALAGLSDGVITVAASEYKSQLRNREAAAARLSALLTEATAPPPPPRAADPADPRLGRAPSGGQAATVPAQAAAQARRRLRRPEPRRLD